VPTRWSFATFLLCLFLAGIGWSVVNPALGKTIMDLFPVHERGIAMDPRLLRERWAAFAALSAVAACAALAIGPAIERARR
jgi:MFS family permease